MPVVEPYAISEPFSTAGKINMNAQVDRESWAGRKARARCSPNGVEPTRSSGMSIRMTHVLRPAARQISSLSLSPWVPTTNSVSWERGGLIREEDFAHRGTGTQRFCAVPISCPSSMS
jgi:hypothetical protein